MELQPMKRTGSARRNSMEYSFLDDQDTIDGNLQQEMNDFEEPLRESPIRSTVLDAAFNFTNSIVGAGIIGIQI
jgi:hypothetical protein